MNQRTMAKAFAGRLRAVLAVAAVLLLVLLWTGIALTLQNDRRQAIDSAMRANGQLARAFEEHTVRTLSQAHQVAIAVRGQYLQQRAKFDLVRYFNDSQFDRKLVQGIAISDADGHIVLSSFGPIAPTNVADREYFNAHLERDSGQLFVGMPVLARLGKRWTIIVSLRINRPDGKFGGTIGIGLTPEYFSEFYRQIDLGPHGAVNLIGLDGVIRARASENSQQPGQNIREGEIFKQLAIRPAGSYIAVARVDGVRRIQSYRQLKDHPLVIAVGTAEETALAEYQVHRRLYVLGGLLMTLIVVSAALWTMRSVRQVEILRAEELASRNLLSNGEQLSGMVSLHWDIDPDRISWSRSPEALLGPPGVAGYPVFKDLVHPDDVQQWLADRDAALASTKGYRYADFRIMRTDGGQRWISCVQGTVAPSGKTASRHATVTLLDITERKQAESARTESEHRLRDLTQTLENQVQERTTEIRTRERLLHLVTESIPIKIGSYDGNGILRFANTLYANALGYPTVAAALGRRAPELMSGERVEVHRPHFDRAMAGEVQRYEYTPLRESSKRLEITLVPDLSSGTDARGVFVVMLDITERKLAEEQLRTAVSLLTATLEATADGLLVVDMDRQVARFNQRFLDIWKLPRERLEAGGDAQALQAVYDQVTDAEIVRANTNALYATPLAEHFDEIQLKDGRVLERFTCPQLVGGVPVGRVWSFRDITERRRSEAALRDADERYRLVVANMTEGVIVRDAEGVIIDCNASAERILGRTRAEICGGISVVGDWRVIAEDGAPISVGQRSALKALQTGKLQSNVVMGYVRPDSSEFWLSSTSTPLLGGNGDKPTGVFTTFIDITAQKAAEIARTSLEGQLRESQKMEAMGTLAGGIAHDFNNILGAILGNAALASDDLDAGHPARVSIEEIRKAGERAKQLVQQILTFSRKQPQNFVDQPLGRVIEDTVGLLRATLPAGIRIQTELEAAGVNVHADATQIGQVVMNLCTNAWHAVAHHAGNAPGLIQVTLDTLNLTEADSPRFGSARAGLYARLTVRDNGMGMDAETRMRIFEPFFTTKPFGEGTGLGLAVVHGIVQAHNGAIAVTSEPGKGTTFEIIVPAVAGQVQVVTQPDATLRQVATASQRVLYVDDEEAMIFLVKRMLKKLGYVVTAFHRPDEAVAAVRADASAFDVVVSDFNMPGMSGLDVAREVLRIRPDLPVVITSGYITDELRAGAAQLGVRHLIYKPNTVEELCQSIAQVLEKDPMSDTGQGA